MRVVHSNAALTAQRALNNREKPLKKETSLRCLTGPVGAGSDAERRTENEERTTKTQLAMLEEREREKRRKKKHILRLSLGRV